jgi:RNA polymerase sigma-70 factor (ECF subfamily)
MIRWGRCRPASPYPAVCLDDITIVRETPFVRCVLARFGFHRGDIADLCQEIVIGAWRSMSGGRFRPDPAMPLVVALRVWLLGIAWRQASHWRARAFRQRESLHWDPWAQVCEPVEESDPRHDAREALAALARLRRMDQRILILAAQGIGVVDIARHLLCPVPTAAARLRRARLRFVALLARREG